MRAIRARLPDAFAIVGLGAFVAAGWRISPELGLAVAGACAIVVALVLAAAREGA